MITSINVHFPLMLLYIDSQLFVVLYWWKMGDYACVDAVLPFFEGVISSDESSRDCDPLYWDLRALYS